MRSSFFIPALAALAAAAPAPAPQDIDIDMVLAMPNPTYTEEVGAASQVVTYNAASILAVATATIGSVTVTDLPSDVAKRDVLDKRATTTHTCVAQPTGATGAPSVANDPSSFVSNTDFASTAKAAPTPSGYSQSFSNLQASNNAYGYLGFTTLDTYDTAACAAKCNNINGCMAINIYYERDPSVDPGTGCENPAAVTYIKCVFWGGPVTADNAVNAGQWRSNFQVVIAGSNGYMNNTVIVPSGFGTATYLGNAAINAPYDSQGYNTYMGSTIFYSGTFNASLCAAYCSQQNVYNLKHPASDGSPVQTCQFFNTYLLYVNTTSNLQGQYCAIYSEAWSSAYATNVGQYRGNDHYMIEYSYSYTNTTNPGCPNKNGAIHQASKDIAWATLQPFCSTYLGYTTPVKTVSVTATATVQQPNKRALSTPAVLTKYPVTVISSACSLLATPVTTTAVTTVTVATVTATYSA